METDKQNVRENTLARLKCIEGQVRGIQKMVEEERGCIEVLRQFAACDAALRSAARTVVEHHLESCFTEAARDTRARKQLFNELTEIFGRF